MIKSWVPEICSACMHWIGGTGRFVRDDIKPLRTPKKEQQQSPLSCHPRRLVSKKSHQSSKFAKTTSLSFASWSIRHLSVTDSYPPFCHSCVTPLSGPDCTVPTNIVIRLTKSLVRKNLSKGWRLRSWRLSIHYQNELRQLHEMLLSDASPFMDNKYFCSRGVYPGRKYFNCTFSSRHLFPEGNSSLASVNVSVDECECHRSGGSHTASWRNNSGNIGIAWLLYSPLFRKDLPL